MNEKELIAKIRELKQIQPREDWVVLTKRQILGEKASSVKPSFIETIGFIFKHKPAFATIVVLIVLVGVFGFAQNSLPGDTLYSLKRIAEKSQVVFVSENNQPEAQLKLVNKRLAELTQIAETHQTQKLESAINEFQKSAVKAVESLAQIDTKDSEAVKEIIEQTQKIEESKQILTEVYGVAGLEGEEDANPTKVVVEWLLSDLENNTLTEEDQEILSEARKDYEEGNYSKALEEILLLNQ